MTKPLPQLPPSSFSAHLGYLFSELPLAARIEAARAAGFGAIEHPAPYAIDASELQRLIDAAGLPFVQLALPSGDPARGEKGLACLPGRREDFRRSVETGLGFAEAIGCPLVHVMAGVLPDGASREELWPLYLENLRFAAGRAAERGITVLIEPIGVATLANYFLDQPQLGVNALDEIGASNVALLFDAFHATNAGVDAAAFTRRHGHRFAHVHIADHPGRHEPGTGAFDFAGFYEALDASGYGGFIGCEYVPAGDTAAGLGWLIAGKISRQGPASA